MTGGDPAVMVAATGVGLALDQRRMRAALVQIRGDHTHHGAAARRSGFECHQCHGILPQALAITSIVWPSAKRTYALRQSLRRPSRKRKDLTFPRSEEHTSELQSLMRNSYAVFCLKKKKDLERTVYKDA